MKKIAIACLAVLAFAGSAMAQTTTNPLKVSYDVSTDHSQLTKYELAFFLVGGIAPVQTSDLAIVAPDAQRRVEQVLPSMPSTFGVNYVARIRGWAGAVPGEWSSDSNEFNRIPFSPTAVLVKK